MAEQKCLQPEEIPDPAVTDRGHQPDKDRITPMRTQHLEQTVAMQSDH